jgi:transposase
MAEDERFVGIDVGKATLDVASRPDGQHWQVSNNEAGWRELGATLATAPPILIVLEASGGYEAGVVVALAAAGLTPVVANPASTRYFARSIGKRAKTDRVDAVMLAQYAAQVRPAVRPLADETVRRLRALLAWRDDVVAMIVQQKNRLQQAVPAVQPVVQAMLDDLARAKAGVEARLAAVVTSDPAWDARVAQLQTVPGIGAVIATGLAARVTEFGALTNKEVAALLGVAPYARESGRWRGLRTTSGGRSQARRLLYQAVTSALRSHDPVFTTHYQKLRADKKTHKQAMVACMRRLAGILNAMIRDGLTWQDTEVGQGRYLAATA